MTAAVRTVALFLGAGLAVACPVAAAAFNDTTVTAAPGGMAAAGDIKNNTINQTINKIDLANRLVAGSRRMAKVGSLAGRGSSCRSGYCRDYSEACSCSGTLKLDFADKRNSARSLPVKWPSWPGYPRLTAPLPANGAGAGRPAF